MKKACQQTAADISFIAVIRLLKILMLVTMFAVLIVGCHKRPVSGQEARNKPFVASAAREVYHRPSCEWAAKISDDNLLGYDNIAQAEADGKRPCKVCRPDQK